MKKAHGGYLLGVQLPSPEVIGINLDGRELTITLNSYGVGIEKKKYKSARTGEDDYTYCNMQDNAAAFEGWALVFKTKCDEVDKVILDVKDDVKLDIPIKGKNLHYNRFLFRAMMFEKCYSEWFKLSSKIKEMIYDDKDSFIKIFGGEKALFNNKATKIAEPVDVNVTDICKAREVELECWLAKPEQNKNLYRQLPMGIFITDDKTMIPDSNYAVFTHDKSALDLWEIKSDTMHIYELKKYGNKQIGALSELFFYACVCHGLFCDNKVAFNFKPIKAGVSEPPSEEEMDIIRGYHILYKKAYNNEIKRISARLLVPVESGNEVSKSLHSAVKPKIFEIMQSAYCSEIGIHFETPAFFGEDGKIRTC